MRKKGGFAVLAVLAALLGTAALAQAQPRAHRPRLPRHGQHPAVPLSPAAPQSPLPTPAAVNLPLGAVRLECNNDGQASHICETILEAASESARRKYQLVDPAKLEELLARDPALRGCRRDECRASIAEKLQLSRLIDIIVQTQTHRRTTATLLVFDPIAKGIAADFDTQLKPEDSKLRSTIMDAVDRVLLTQRLTAGLKLEVKPTGVRVSIKDGRGGVRALTDAERDGEKEVREFLGTYTVHAEKPGFIAQDQTVTVTQAGASVQIELKTQPVKVKFDWSPPEARVVVDGYPVDPRDRMVELLEGVHKVEALAPRGAPYESTVRDLVVKQGMEPVLIALQRLAELRLQAPLGYVVSVDNQLLPTSSLQATGYMVETSYPITAGSHSISATSWRGLLLSRHVEVLPRASTDVLLKPPALAPGILLMTLGAASLVTGGVLLALDGQPTDARNLYHYNFSIGGALALGLGGAGLLAGTIWFGHNAANHPRFHRVNPSPGSALRQRLLVVPNFGIASAGILTQLKF